MVTRVPSHRPGSLPSDQPRPVGPCGSRPSGGIEGLLLPHGLFQGVKVKGLILINPWNPLGDIYSPGELQEYLEFAKR